MYMLKKHYIGNKYKEPHQRVTVSLPAEHKANIKDERIQEIVEEVAYWRKANQIHKWFSDNVAEGDFKNGADMYVSSKQLGELLEVCKKVLAASKLVEGKIENGKTMVDGKWEPIMEDGKFIEDPTVAKELLPTESGFFFGGTDYDEYYISDIQQTVEQLEKILGEDEDRASYYYTANW